MLSKSDQITDLIISRPDSYDQMAGTEKGRSESVNLNRNVTAKSVPE